MSPKTSLHKMESTDLSSKGIFSKLDTISGLFSGSKSRLIRSLVFVNLEYRSNDPAPASKSLPTK